MSEIMYLLLPISDVIYKLDVLIKCVFINVKHVIEIQFTR